MKISTIEFVDQNSPLPGEDDAFSEWESRVKKILGVESLDGDERVNGYSLDHAWESFSCGITSQEYAREVKCLM